VFIKSADTSTLMTQPQAPGTAPWRRWTWLAPGLLVYTICRVPSFFEPHWYTDEAGYATTARAVLRGLPLYVQAWTNKPPLHIWTVALPLSLFGPREAGLHALTFVSGLLSAGRQHRFRACDRAATLPDGTAGSREPADRPGYMGWTVGADAGDSERWR